MRLRPYQTHCRAAVLSALENDTGTLMVLATGLGKTVTFGHIAHDYVENGRRVLVLAHRIELLQQAANKLRAITGDWVDYERADQWADKPSIVQERAQIIVATTQTLGGRWDKGGVQGKRVARFDWREFGLVIRDEAHRVATPQDMEIMDHIRNVNPDIRFLGPTATPDRKDKRSLDCLFDSCAYRYEALEAIDDGWLVPVVSRPVVIREVNLDNVEVRAGQFNGRQLDDELARHAAAVARVTLDHSENRKTLVFCAGVNAAQATTDCLNSAGFEPGCARLITGKTPAEERARIWSDYRMGVFRILVNVGVATEGVDVPDIGCIVCAKPTLSRVVSCQQIGRGMRPVDGILDDLFDDHPMLGDPHSPAARRRERILGSPKPNLLVLDIVGNTSRHDLVTPFDALAGDRYTPEVLAAAARDGGDIKTALDKAQKSADQRKADAAARAAAEAARIADWNRKRVTVDAEVGEGVLLGGVYAGQPRRHNQAISPKQSAALKKFGIPIDGLNVKSASVVLAKLFEKKDSGASWDEAKAFARGVAARASGQSKPAPVAAMAAAAPGPAADQDLWEYQ